MPNSNSTNKTLLNKLFTSRELTFVNNIDTDIDKIESIIQKEELNNSKLKNLINELNNLSSEKDSQLELDSINQLISESQMILQLINDNIKTLNINKHTYDEIKKSLIDLFVKIETEGASISDYEFSSDMIDMRNVINTFYNCIEKENLQISLNRTKIDNFFNKSIVKKYLTYYNIEDEEDDDKEENIDNNKNNSSTSTLQDIASSAKKRINKTLSGNLKESNPVLLISEKEKKVFLPYTQAEIETYLKQYPNQYKNFADVVKKEFILPLDFFMKHPVVARFREAFSLMRDRESKPVIEAIKFAVDLMFKSDLSPVIIAACKNLKQLHRYLICLEEKRTNDFKDFELLFEIPPMAN